MFFHYFRESGYPVESAFQISDIIRYILRDKEKDFLHILVYRVMSVFGLFLKDGDPGLIIGGGKARDYVPLEP